MIYVRVNLELQPKVDVREKQKSKNKKRFCRFLVSPILALLHPSNG